MKRCVACLALMVLASAVGLTFGAIGLPPPAQDIPQTFVRASQVGYLPDDPKTGVVFSTGALPISFEVIDERGRVAASGGPRASGAQRWGRFTAHGALQALQDLFGGAQVVQVLWPDLLHVEDRAPDPLL